MEDEDHQVDTSNPFLEGQKTKNTLLDTAVQILATVTSRKSPSKFLCVFNLHLIHISFMSNYQKWQLNYIGVSQLGCWVAHSGLTSKKFFVAKAPYMCNM